MAQIGIIKVKRLIESLVSFVKVDYQSKLQEGFVNESFLYRCFDQDDFIEKVNYLQTAIELFTRPVTDSRVLEIRLLFDRDRATLPTIHVREPAKMKGQSDGIGFIGEQLFLNDQRFDEEDEPILPNTYTYSVRRSFSSQYELLITSANRHEVLIIEEVIMALLMGGQDMLSSVLPFDLNQVSVRELMFNDNLSPNVFIKAINLNVTYDKVYPEIVDNPIIQKILFEHQLLNNG